MALLPGEVASSTTGVKRSVGIVVADGDPAVRRIVGTALRDKGYTVWEGGSAEEALDLFVKNQGKVAALLIDLHLPGGGPATLKIIRAREPGLPCSFMAASMGDDQIQNQLRELGAPCDLFKPFRISHLLEVVQRLVGSGK